MTIVEVLSSCGLSRRTLMRRLAEGVPGARLARRGRLPVWEIPAAALAGLGLRKRGRKRKS